MSMSKAKYRVPEDWRRKEHTQTGQSTSRKAMFKPMKDKQGLASEEDKCWRQREQSVGRVWKKLAHLRTEKRPVRARSTVLESWELRLAIMQQGLLETTPLPESSLQLWSYQVHYKGIPPVSSSNTRQEAKSCFENTIPCSEPSAEYNCMP